MILPILYIAPSQFRGRGVFASEDIPAGTIVEISPVIVFSAAERAAIEKTSLFNYIFEWGDDCKQACVALGYVSMYNHSYDANCTYEMDYDDQLITITTVKPIKEGEEVYINYNATADDKTPVWFETK